MYGFSNKLYRYRTGWEAGFAQENPIFPREELFIHDTKNLRAGEEEGGRRRERKKEGGRERGGRAVSYTHLTLPTIVGV